MSGWKLLLCLPAFLGTALGQEGSLYPVVRKLKTGFIDRQGKMVIEPQFDGSSLGKLGAFGTADPLYPVSKDLKWGYIDRTGAVKIPFQFSLAGKFSEGLAPVRVDSQVNGLWQSKFGYVDTSGTLAIPATFDQAGPFSEGLALVTTGELSGYIDKTGAFAIPARFTQLMDHTSTFSEGLAAVRLAPAPVVTTGEARTSTAAPDSAWGYIDKRGEWVIQPRFRTASAFHDGVALVTDQSGYVYIRRSGEKAAGPYRTAWEFSGGLGRVEKEDGAPAFITPGGQIAFTLPKSVLFVYPFSGGLARAWVREGDGHGRDRYGYIDTKGQFAIPASYDGGTEFNDGLAFVGSCGQSGYIDAANRPVWGIKMLPAPTTPIPAGLPSANALGARALRR